MEDRKRSLELFAKQLSEGLPFAEDFTEKSPNLEWNALDARDLSEDALANQVMKNTGVPIPSNGASASKKEDFLNRIVAERYPEFKDPNVRLGDADQYFKGQIDVKNRDDLTNMVGKSLHEAGHKYDDTVLGSPGKNLNLKTLRDARKSGLDLKSMDPAQLYEMYAKGHHAEIPKLREGSFGLGALKSMMKSGTFKALPIIGPAAGLAMGLDSADASAAIPGLDSAESVGESAEDEKMMLAEDAARKNYSNSPAHSARLEAMKKLGNN